MSSRWQATGMFPLFSARLKQDAPKSTGLFPEEDMRP